MNKRKFIAGLLASCGAATFGAYAWQHRWRYIVIHHSAGTFGNIPFLQKVHRQRQAEDPIDAIPYHYIIGNGNGMKLGAIASDWRLKYSLWGAHVSNNNPDRNLRGIGICLIGNLEDHPLPEVQYQALVKLVTTLMRKYQIPRDHVIGHGHLQGESTLCPGRHFPRDRLIGDLTLYT